MKKRYLLSILLVVVILLVLLFYKNFAALSEERGEYWSCVTTKEGTQMNISCNSDKDCLFENIKDFCSSYNMEFLVPACSFTSYCNKEKLCKVYCY